MERKDDATRRASAQSTGYALTAQPYSPAGANIEKMVKDGYEKVIWAFRAIDAIADKMSGWPIACMEGMEPDWKAVDDPILPLLNGYSNQIERSAKYFRYRLVSQFILSKKGVFVEAIPSRSGLKVAALNLLPPGLTSPIPDPDKFIAGFRVQLPGNERMPYVDLPVYDPKTKRGVIWIRKPHPTDPYSSVTPLEAAGISLDLDFYARLYNRNFLINDGRAGQIVAVKGGLSTEDAIELKTRFTPGMGGAGRTTVIEADSVSVEDTAVTPRDAQYAELRKITKDDLLIALGTPESVLGNASGRTFDNADAEKENWLDVTVLPASQVVESAFDVLTEGGYDDERAIVHDTSNEPVLKRRWEARVEKARADVAAGLITIDEYRDIAELEKLGRPGSRVLWVPAGGKVAIGKDESDEEAAGELKPLAAGGEEPPVDPAAAGPGGLEGFDVLTGSFGQPQAQPTALEAASADLDLEFKAFNPRQPRYPQGHPQGGQFMDSGDIALWLAGKPLRDGTPSSSVSNPNAQSTASPASTAGAAGGAARFTQSPDPKVRAAAEVVTFPANYPYPRVLGAPAAKALKAPKQVKAVSLRKGDVVMVRGSNRAVANAKRVPGGNIELELVDDQGNVTTHTTAGSQTLSAVARTPHPTVVAQAKRDIAAYARTLAAGAAAQPASAPNPAGVGAPPVTAAAAQASATTSNRAPVIGAQGPFTHTPVGVYQRYDASGNRAGELFVRADGTGEYHRPANVVGNRVQPLTAADVQLQLQSNAYGSQYVYTSAALPQAMQTPVAAAQPAAPSSTGFQVGQTVFDPSGRRSRITSISGVNVTVQGVNMAGVRQTRVYNASQLRPLSAVGGSPASVSPQPMKVGDHVLPADQDRLEVGDELTTRGGSTMVIQSSGGDALLYIGGVGSPPITQTYSDVTRQLGGSPWTVMGKQAPLGMGVTHQGVPSSPTPPPAPAAPAAPAPVPSVAMFNLPPAPAGSTIYVHPTSGKHIYVLPGGGLQCWRADGKKATTSATPAKLAAGHGLWKQVPAPLTGMVPSKRSSSQTPAPTPAPPAGAPAGPPNPAPAAVTPTTPPAHVPPPATVPPVTGSADAARVIAAGVPTVAVTSTWRRTGSQGGSNPAAELTDPSGKRFYVKSLDAKHSDNEVAAARLYAAAGVSVPKVNRATLASGMFGGQRGSDGIASEMVSGTPDMSTRMRSNASYRDAVLADFAVHAWLGNWDAVENNNTQTAPDGRPMTIDVGGSMMFRAQGGARPVGGRARGAFGDQVSELTSMRTGNTAGGSARAAFAQLTPDHTDARFVKGVERIAAITPDQLEKIVDSSYPSLSVKERTDLKAVLLKRREHLATVARVDLPEKKQAAAGAPGAAAAAPAPAAPSTPAAPTAPVAGTPAPAGAANLLGAASPSSILTPPPGYPYPIVANAPVAATLVQPKAIKVASLRKGDVIQHGGAGGVATVISVDRKSMDIVVLNNAGQQVTVRGTTHPSGQVLAVARTPHPQVVAAARRQLAAGGQAQPTPTVNAPAAQQVANPNLVRTTPAFTSHVQAMSAARNYGTAQQAGYAPVPGQTYATPLGDMLVVHSDGSGDFLPSVQTPGMPAARPMTAAQITTMLDTGTTYVPVGPQLLTPTFSIRVGRHGNANGDYVDVNPDGSGTLHLANGNVTQLNEQGVDALLSNQNPQAANAAQFLMGFVGPSPAVRSGPAQQTAAATAQQAHALVGARMPAGGWGAAGQIVPGASFVLPSSGAVLTIGPRGGGKMVVGGKTRNMSAAAAQSALNRRGGQWRLQAPGPSAMVTHQAPTTVTPQPVPTAAAPAAPAAPQLPPFVSKVGQPASSVVTEGLQPGQVFRSAKQQMQITVQPDGRGLRVDTSVANGGAVYLSPAQMNRALSGKTTGWVATSGPDIDQPGPRHAAALRRAQRGVALPPPGTPIQGVPPLNASYPAAATGQVTPATVGDLSRGHTVRVNGEDWIVTGVAPASSGRARRFDVWGYRPGIDDPNLVTQDANTKQWNQGAKIPTLAEFGKTKTVDIVGPAAAPAAHVPTNGKARAFDPAGNTPTTTTGVGSQFAGQGGVPAGGFDVISQLVNADELKPGDVIILNGREAEGTFVVTKLDVDHKGRPAVYGYAGTQADATGVAGVGDKLFLQSPGANMRQVRVQVNGAPPPLPVVPRPTPPQAPSGINRNDISDASSQARIAQIIKGPPPTLPSLPSITSVGDRMIGHLMEMRGYNAHPDVISDADMDTYIADGEIELWRGIGGRYGASTHDYAEDYRSGPHYPGGTSGTMYGTGTYTAYGYHRGGQRDAVKFAQQYATGTHGVVVRMTLKSDARVIEHDVLVREMRADNDPNVRQLLRHVASDAALGHYAILKGYDAIRKSHGYQPSHGKTSGESWDDGFLVVLNRSAVRVSETNYGGPPSSAKRKPVSAAKHVMKSTSAKHGNGVDYKVVAE